MTFGRPFSSGDSGRVRPGLADVLLAGLVALNVLFLCAWALGTVELRYAREREIPLKLAATDGVRTLRISAREVIVHVGPAGEIRVAGRAVALDELGRRLARLVNEAGRMSVTIRADARVHYGLVARILGAARDAGVQDVALLTVGRGTPSEPGTRLLP